MEKEKIKFHLPDASKLTNEQRALIKLDLASSKRKNLVVKWYWWTGKTVVAYYRALSWQNDRYKYNWKWERVLLLCFNRLLNSLLKSEDNYPLTCDVKYLQEFYNWLRGVLIWHINRNSWLKPYEWKLSYDGWYFYFQQFKKRSDYKTIHHYIVYKKWDKTISEDISWTWYYAWNQSKEFLDLLFNRYLQYKWKKMYKEIIIDEWQDISKYMIENLLKLTDHISIFADDHQQIQWWASIQEMSEILLSWFDEPEQLTKVMRTTKEIFEYAVETFLPEDEQAHGMQIAKWCISIPESRPDMNSWYEEDNNSRYISIENLIEKLLNQDDELTAKWKLKISNIMVVCPWKVEIKQLSKILIWDKILHSIYYNWIEFEWTNNQLASIATNDSSWDENNILITTYKSAKWLEADCVIIYISDIEYQKYMEWWDKSDNTFYTLSTRPKRKLLFVTNFPLSE